MSCLRWGWLALVVAACSPATTVRLNDGGTMTGELVQIPDEPRALVMHRPTEGGERELVRLDPEAIESTTLPGTASLWTGGILLAHGVTGMAATLFMARPVDHGPMDDPWEDYDDAGCEGCVTGLAIAGSMLGLGIWHLIGGLSYRLRALRRLGRDPRPVGRPQLIGGGVLVALAAAGFAATLPLSFPGKSDAGEVVGAVFMGMAPGLALLGIALLVRGAHLRVRPRRWPAFGPEGLVFDLSL